MNQSRSMTSQKNPKSGRTSAPPNPKQDPSTMDRILQEITAVGRQLEVMDSKITALMAETKSLHTDVAGFQGRMDGPRTKGGKDRGSDRHCCGSRSRALTSKEKDHRPQGQKLQRQRPFFGFPEQSEKLDAKDFLKSILPGPTGLTFTSPLEFQRVHCIGPPRRNH